MHKTQNKPENQEHDAQKFCQSFVKTQNKPQNQDFDAQEDSMLNMIDQHRQHGLVDHPIQSTRYLISA